VFLDRSREGCQPRLSTGHNVPGFTAAVSRCSINHAVKGSETLEQLNRHLRRVAQREATDLTGVLATLSLQEQVEYLIPLLLGAGACLGGRSVAAAVKTVAAEKAADLVMEGFHVEALRIAATLGDRELANKAYDIGMEAHPDPDDQYHQRLRQIYTDEVGDAYDLRT